MRCEECRDPGWKDRAVELCRECATLWYARIEAAEKALAWWRAEHDPACPPTEPTFSAMCSALAELSMLEKVREAKMQIGEDCIKCGTRWSGVYVENLLKNGNGIVCYCNKCGYTHRTQLPSFAELEALDEKERGPVANAVFAALNKPTDPELDAVMNERDELLAVCRELDARGALVCGREKAAMYLGAPHDAATCPMCRLRGIIKRVG